jgi:hypothetical protein
MKEKPIKQVDFKIIQEPLTGLVINLDRDLQHRASEAEQRNQIDEARQFMALLIMLRFANNSYEAVSFLLSDVDQHSRRLPRFVLVVPSVCRQIMDLWFTLVYITDDFTPRLLEYQQGGYRELRQQIADTQRLYGADNPDWQDWYTDMGETSTMAETYYKMTPAQLADPIPTPSNKGKAAIQSWPYPHSLCQRQSKCQDFLKLLNDLFYAEASAYAHVKPSALAVCGGMLLADIAPPHFQKVIEERTRHQFKFRHFCRVVIALLGIASEIEVQCNLNNKEQAKKVWERFSEHSPDAKDVFEARYKSLLS